VRAMVRERVAELRRKCIEALGVRSCLEAQARLRAAFEAAGVDPVIPWALPDDTSIEADQDHVETACQQVCSDLSDIFCRWALMPGRRLGTICGPVRTPGWAGPVLVRAIGELAGLKATVEDGRVGGMRVSIGNFLSPEWEARATSAGAVGLYAERITELRRRIASETVELERARSFLSATVEVAEGSIEVARAELAALQAVVEQAAAQTNV